MWEDYEHAGEQGRGVSGGEIRQPVLRRQGIRRRWKFLPEKSPNGRFFFELQGRRGKGESGRRKPKGPGLRAGPGMSAANSGREATHAQRVTGLPGFAKGENGRRKPHKGRVCERGPGMSAANSGREATHAQRVTGLPGFVEGEMGGASRTRAGFASGAPE